MPTHQYKYTKLQAAKRASAVIKVKVYYTLVPPILSRLVQDPSITSDADFDKLIVAQIVAAESAHKTPVSQFGGSDATE